MTYNQKSVEKANTKENIDVISDGAKEIEFKKIVPKKTRKKKSKVDVFIT